MYSRNCVKLIHAFYKKGSVSLQKLFATIGQEFKSKGENIKFCLISGSVTEVQKARVAQS